MKIGPFLTVFILMVVVGSAGVPLALAQTPDPGINADNDDPGSGGDPVTPTSTPTPCPTGEVLTCSECNADPVWCGMAYPGRLGQCAWDSGYQNPTPFVYNTSTPTPAVTPTPSGTVTVTPTAEPLVPQLVEVWPDPGDITLYNASPDTVYVEVAGPIADLVKGSDTDDLVYPDGIECYEVVVAIRWTVAAASDTMRWRAAVDDDTNPYDVPPGWANWQARTDDKLSNGALQQINIGCGMDLALTTMDQGYISASIERYNGSDPAAQAEVMYYSYYALQQPIEEPLCTYSLGEWFSDYYFDELGYLTGTSAIFNAPNPSTYDDWTVGVAFVNPNEAITYSSPYSGTGGYANFIEVETFSDSANICLEDPSARDDFSVSPCEWFSSEYYVADRFQTALSCYQSHVCAFDVTTQGTPYQFTPIILSCSSGSGGQGGCVIDVDDMFDDWEPIRDPNNCYTLVPRIGPIELQNVPIFDYVDIDVKEFQVCFDLYPEQVIPIPGTDWEFRLGVILSIAFLLAAVSLVVL